MFSNSYVFSKTLRDAYRLKHPCTGTALGILIVFPLFCSWILPLTY